MGHDVWRNLRQAKENQYFDKVNANLLKKLKDKGSAAEQSSADSDRELSSALDTRVEKTVVTKTR